MKTPPTVSPVVLVTGAARRIGAAIARRLHAEGCDLALHYRNSETDMRELQAELENTRPDSVLRLQADLGQADASQTLVTRTLERFGRLDGLVNNASAFFPSALDGTTAAQWDTLFAVNARAPFFLSQAAAPYLRETHGAIVNLTDIHAVRPRPDVLAYAMSKAALQALTRGLASALAPDIRVNAVAPGAILWPETDTDVDTRKAMLARTPLARTGTVEEVAEAVFWLLRKADYTTGEVLRVDGGRSVD